MSDEEVEESKTESTTNNIKLNNVLTQLNEMKNKINKKNIQDNEFKLLIKFYTQNLNTLIQGLGEKIIELKKKLENIDSKKSENGIIIDKILEDINNISDIVNSVNDEPNNRIFNTDNKLTNEEIKALENTTDEDIKQKFSNIKKIIDNITTQYLNDNEETGFKTPLGTSPTKGGKKHKRRKSQKKHKKRQTKKRHR